MSRLLVFFLLAAYPIGSNTVTLDVTQHVRHALLVREVNNAVVARLAGGNRLIEARRDLDTKFKNLDEMNAAIEELFQAAANNLRLSQTALCSASRLVKFHVELSNTLVEPALDVSELLLMPKGSCLEAD